MAKPAKERFAMLMGTKPKPITAYGGRKFPNDVGTVLAVLETNKSTEVNVVRINEYKGKRSLDVRRYYEKNGEWAVGKGTAFPDWSVGDFLEALRQNSGRILQAIGKGATT